MRKNGTKAEAMLWNQLRNRQMGGFSFRRQVPMDGYIADFVCYSARLIIEVDGWQHADSESDAVRDAHFRNHGFRILRFWNDEVTDNLDAVCRKVLLELGAVR